MDKDLKAKLNRQIEELLRASQKPFDNRLEAALYLYVADETTQERATLMAKQLAAFLQEMFYIDVNRQP